MSPFKLNPAFTWNANFPTINPAWSPNSDVPITTPTQAGILVGVTDSSSIPIPSANTAVLPKDMQAWSKNKIVVFTK